ncbi:MAG: spinster family MFS transporter [Acidobacteriota bacterium]
MSHTARAARWSLGVLAFVNLFNYLDRFVVSSLVESLKKSELALTDGQLGSLASAFVLVYMAASPLFGAAGDRGRRPFLLAAGVAFWSLATAAGALARSFGALFSARAAVGVGEAAYGTIAPAMLLDLFPPERRGRVFAIFFSAAPVGAAAGYIVGGLADARFGWRAAFGIAGLPGLLLATLCLALPDPVRGGMERSSPLPSSGGRGRRAPHRGSLPPGEGNAPHRQGAEGRYRRLLANRPYLLTVAGYAAYTFALGALAFWMPAFLERVRGVPRSDATVQFGVIAVATGLLGTFAGGWIADRWRPRRREADLWLSGWATLAAAPATLVAVTAERPSVYLPAIVVGQLLLFASTGPVNAAALKVVAPAERSTASGLLILAIHLFGDVPSPPLVGAISDATSLGRAFLILPAAIAVGGAIWLYAAWRGERAPLTPTLSRRERG